MKENIYPEVKETSRGREEHTHPAFGTITMTTVQGGSPVLFGSDIGHNQRVLISISTAKKIRDLSKDWIHPDKEFLEFEMSHSQFSQFITSQGRGAGTPVTLLRYENELIPGIKRIETKNETFKKEIRKSADEEIRRQFQEEIDRLGKLIEEGKTSKKELASIHFNMKNRLQNFGPNMEFVVAQAEEALEKATTNSRIEIEATVENYIRSLGVEQAQLIGLISPEMKLKEIDNG